MGLKKITGFLYAVQNAGQDCSQLIKAWDLDAGTLGSSPPHALEKIPKLISERCTNESAELYCFWDKGICGALPWRCGSPLSGSSALSNQWDALRAV